jgi:hypothetical protein
MPDDLVRDTLTFLKDPLFAKHSMLASPEEVQFFKKKPEAPVVIAPKPPEKIPIPPPRAVQPPQDLSPLKKTLQRIAPSMKMVDQVPEDAEAKRIASAWKEKIVDAQVVFLVCNIDAETLEFLKGLAKAVDHHLAKTKILMAERLEKEKRWDLFLEKNAFRLIIASEGIQQWPELMRFYRAMPASNQLFLDKTPLFVLSTAALYKSLEHKAHLWKTLCQLLK